MPKRLLTCIGLCLTSLAIFLVAPALSVQPYVPDPIDFSQPLPAVQRVADLAGASGLRTAARQPTFAPDSPNQPGVRWITSEVTAPKTFDAVGLAGDQRAVEMRTKRAAADWTAWHEVDSGDPVWAGHSKQVQIRSRDARPRGKLYYVNVSATDSGLHHLIASARGAIHTAFISVAGSPFATAASKPPFVTRSRWGASKCKPRDKPELGKVKAAVVHHTVNTNDYTSAEAPGIVLAICRYHRNANGWNDIGYNALVDRFGKIYVGRAGGTTKAIVGAQAQGFNAQTTGIASIGDHSAAPDGKPINSKERSMIARYLAWNLKTVHKVNPNSRVVLVSAGGSLTQWKKGRHVHVWRVTYHSALDSTDCPGSQGRHQVKAIRELAQRKT